MRHTNTFPILTAGIRSAVERLGALRPSPEVLALKDAVRTLAAELAIWPSPLPRERHQSLLRRVLAIHFAIAHLVPRRRGVR